MNSPDFYHSVRVSQASLKAQDVRVQLAECKAHKAHVDEYKLDIHHHLLELDTKTRPNLHLIQQQPEINLRMRPLLLDFLMDVINKLNLSKSTFPLTVNIIDRYCSVRIVKKQHYQLLGLTALWIACKNLDSKFRIPSLNDLCKYCCHCYDKKLFLEMENHVLKSLGWLVDAPTFDSFVDLYINALASSSFLAGSKNPHKACNDVKIVALYICELIQFYPNIYFNYSSPKIALLSVVLAALILNTSSAFTTHEFLAYVAAETDVEIINHDTYNQAFALFIKVLKCPPPSLKTKYFNEDSRFLNLMKQLVAFTWKHLAPNSVFSHTGAAPTSSDCGVIELNTPVSRDEPSGSPTSLGGSVTPKFYPATPISSSISPKNADSTGFERPVLTPQASAPVYTKFVPALSPRTHKTLPSPNLSPAEHDRQMFGEKRSYEGQAPPVKRSKSMSKAVFYIH
ncbi:hypothetical_protein [Candidozyma auris]|uniref:cyclin CLN3 n=1 Tax=Candidozyma auris TaxID=498019 RepID=UPI000D2D6F45|nr:cyclin CLN3 [[Candida] auris]QEO20336.1 hypothetical_protein [[Candida] auris]GBL49691.1 hypothetical protein CAJCM15448_19650 [[Candida] auris]